MFKHMSAAEVTANLMNAEINFFNQCSKWLNYFKIDKTILGIVGFEKVILNFVPENDHHTRYALLTGPVLALSLKGFGVEVFESHMYPLKDTVIIIATKNGYSWTGIMWFQVKLEETVTKEGLKTNI